MECFCCGATQDVAKLPRENMPLCPPCRRDPALDINECLHGLTLPEHGGEA